ncbi:C-terminal binding protein [Rubellimicrobium rubrum]|uniref:C-terminal binding protein n=1 Tax=Rubellimicrobium rubrum TaxID=2585369 RepID=A0A5C4N1H3_9RHOB|nr:C-terminal binding protein [Rubellimicrobium rubrum]TNC52437.1 C-terminal binding protein [Rubellimicrobium rubrum]
MKVVVTDTTFPTLDQEERAARKGGAEFARFQARTAEEVAEAVAGAKVALVQFAPFTEAAAKAMAPGGTVIRYGVGYDNIDVAATKAAGLRVGYVPDYCADEVAEHTAAMALAMLRKLPQLDASVRDNDWAAVKVSRPLKPFAETVFGFFGLGQIGRAVLGRLKDFGFRFAASDPGLSPQDAEALGVTLMTPEELLREADVISLHAPATAETRGYFDAQRLETMKPHAILINSARGQLIDENDLAAALRAGIIGGAALDVFGTEPLPPESPLRSAPNCLLTPHAAWYSDAAIGRLQGLVAEDVARALRGEGPRKPVPG